MGAFLVVCGIAVCSAAPQATAAASGRPSFVVIQTDDQTLATLDPAYGVMAYTRELIAGHGMTFNNYYVSYPLCCPSRVSLLTGQYAHNHNVRGNIPPSGGFTGFATRPAKDHNLATWLHAAGYRTIHLGKFLNGYGDLPFDAGTTVPPGWDAWYTVERADTEHLFYGYQLNVNGEVDGPFGDPGSSETREYGVRDDPGCPTAPANGLPCYYITDYLTALARSEILAAPRDRPFYLQLDYTAPHGDFRRPAGPEPAPRHYDWERTAALPHETYEGFNEANVSDKPLFIREAPRLTPEEVHSYQVYFQKQLESLLSVDEGVKAIIEALGQAHRLRNTYVIFTSDNGFFFGEHRLIGGKFLAYEPATHLPFLIRGPGIPAGSETNALAANIDIAPTVLQLAHAKADRPIDGRPMIPIFRHPARQTRRPILFESFVETSDVEGQGLISSRRHDRGTVSVTAPPKDYAGIRLGKYKYIAWPDGETELYDLEKDPFELNNRSGSRNLAPIRSFLHRQLLRLTRCVGRRCRESVPRLPPTLREARRRQAKERQRGVTGVGGVLRGAR
jgi:N-acetylglucosamine-6-sulfatase